MAFVLEVSMASVADEYIHQDTNTTRIMFSTMMMMTTQEEEEIMVNLEKEGQAEAGAEILHQEGADPVVEIPEAL